MSKTYTVIYCCTNCQHSESKEIPYGELAPTLLQCKNCGCNTARNNKPSPWPYPPTPPRPRPYPPERDRLPPTPWRKPGPNDRPWPNPRDVDPYPRYWCGRTTHVAVFP